MNIVRKGICVVLASALFWGCVTDSASNSYVPSVSLTRPVALNHETTRICSGIVKAADEVNLGFKTAGQIARIYVEEGDFVRQGQLVAELDTVDYRLAVEALQIQYEQLSTEMKRMQRLYEQRSVSRNDYEKARAGLRQLGVQLQVNRNKLAYTKLYAPTDGYVQRVNFSEVEMVDAGTALMSLLDVSSLKVETAISVNDFLHHDRFTRFSCRASNIQGAVPMRLGGMTPKADGNQLYQMTLNFVAPVPELTAGMNVEVEITIADTVRSRGFSVPLGAIFFDGTTACVWVYGADSTVRRRAVVLDNVDEEGKGVVVDGLNGDEWIVRAGVSSLEDGERVRVVPTSSQTNVGGLL